MFCNVNNVYSLVKTGQNAKSFKRYLLRGTNVSLCNCPVKLG